MVVSNRNLLFQGSIFRGELLVSGRVYNHFNNLDFDTGYSTHITTFWADVKSVTDSPAYGQYMIACETAAQSIEMA